MMQRGAGALSLLMAIAANAAAEAQTADLTRATCADWLDLSRNDRAQLIVWLHGYYAGAAQRAMLDRTKLEDALAAIQQLCERNRAMPLIGSEARSLFLGEAPPPPTATAPSPGAERAPASGSPRSPLP